jgi:hypothetical protein
LLLSRLLPVKPQKRQATTAPATKPAITTSKRTTTITTTTTRYVDGLISIGNTLSPGQTLTSKQKLVAKDNVHQAWIQDGKIYYLTARGLTYGYVQSGKIDSIKMETNGYLSFFDASKKKISQVGSKTESLGAWLML